MPPKRRTSGHGSAASAQRAQPKLSFGRQASNRITKPGATKQTSKVKADPDLVEPVANVEPNPSSEPTTAEAAILEQAASVTAEVDPLEQENQKTEDVLGGRAPFSDTGARGGKSDSGWNGDEEGQARKMTDAQIKKYWQAKERERKAPRVHQGDLTLQEKILREWDMSGQYGPCIGIARIKRWKRANMLGLKPPVEILAVLLKEADKGNAKVQRAHVDELMSSRFIET